MQPVNKEYKGYTITTDKNLMQPEAIHKWLSEESYWSKGITFDIVKTAFDNSFCAGILKDGGQVGYGRLITDYATFGYFADVYVQEAHRGQGLAREMLNVLMGQPWVDGLRKLMLSTLDAHGFYEPFGFTVPAFPERYMEISHVLDYNKINHQNDANFHT